MRVAILRDIPEERRRSMERFADELSSSLRALAVTVRPMTVHAPARGGRVGALGARASRFAGFPLKAASAAALGGADVYHVVDHGYADLVAALPRSRTIVTCHDLMLLRAAGAGADIGASRSALARFRFSVSFLRRAAHVACDSEETRRDVVRLAGVVEQRASVIAPGVDERFRVLDDARRQRVRAQLGRPGEKLLFHISTGLDYKNVPATLRTLAALLEFGVRARLVRVGPPLSLNDDALHRALGLEQHVNELGWVSDERLVDAYNACDLLLFPSHHEGFGWPVLEAMACGTPVAASDCAALRETAGDAALLAAPSDIAGHVANARSILEGDRLAADLVARGIRRAGMFTWQRTATAYVGLYRRVSGQIGAER